MKSAIRVLLLAGVAVYWFLSVRMWRGALVSPNEQSGQVWPVNDHGQTKYVTEIEYAWVQATPWLAVAVIVAAIVGIFMRLRRGEGPASARVEPSEDTQSSSKVQPWIEEMRRRLANNEPPNQ